MKAPFSIKEDPSDGFSDPLVDAFVTDYNAAISTFRNHPQEQGKSPSSAEMLSTAARNFFLHTTSITRSKAQEVLALLEAAHHVVSSIFPSKPTQDPPYQFATHLKKRVEALRSSLQS